MKQKKNNSTIETWIRETRRYASHTSWNNFININYQLNQPNDKKVKEILEHGYKIREAIFKGRSQLKQTISEIVTENHQDIFAKKTKIVDEEFSKIIHKESISYTSSQQ